MDIRIATDEDEFKREVEKKITDEVKEKISEGDREMNEFALVQFPISFEDPTPHRKECTSNLLVDLIGGKRDIDQREKQNQNERGKSTEKVKI